MHKLPENGSLVM